MKFSKHWIYAVLSFSFPIITLLTTLAYQSVANADFWLSLTSDDNAVGAMMAASEVIQLTVLTLAGCVVGLVFAAMSLHIQKRVVGIGFAALVFNSLPFLILLSLWIKVRI